MIEQLNHIMLAKIVNQSSYFPVRLRRTSYTVYRYKKNTDRKQALFCRTKW